MRPQHIDVFALVDTRSVAAATRKHEALMKARLGDAAGCHSIPSYLIYHLGLPNEGVTPCLRLLARVLSRPMYFRWARAYVSIVSSYWPQYNPSGSDALYARINAGLLRLMPVLTNT